MAFYALTYDVVEDFPTKRMPYRPQHLEMVQSAHQRGEIVLAGPLGDPPIGALILFRAQSPALAEDFARNDPYVKEGLVTRWQVRPWNIVVGQAVFEPPVTST